MHRLYKSNIFLLIIYFIINTFSLHIYAGNKIIDNFENTDQWKKIQSEGVNLKLSSAPGKTGKALEYKIDFNNNKGYVVAIKDISFKLPDNYKFTFYIKGDLPSNTLEFKIMDKDGNTFWKPVSNFFFSKKWNKVTIKKRHIKFAWGPAEGGEIKNVARIEIAISCGKGGKGRVLIDELSLIDVDSAKTKFIMNASASSEEKSEFSASKAVDGDKNTRWASVFEDNHWLLLDITKVSDFVGITIHWETAYAKEYDILISNDKNKWKKIYSTKESDGGMDDIYFGKKSARYIKIHAKKRATEWGNSIFEISLKGLEKQVKVSTSSTKKGKPSNIMDGYMEKSWQSKNIKKEKITLELNKIRDIGGIIIYWDKNYAKSYSVSISSDKKTWVKAFKTKKSNGDRDRIFFKDAEAKYIRIDCNKSATGKGYGIKEIELRDYEETGDQNKYYELTAEEAPLGYYPKYFRKKQTYWTIIGVTEDKKEALFNEEGQFETEKEHFSIEPFLYINNKLITWGDVQYSQFLEKGYLPIPEVKWKYKKIELSIKIFAEGQSGNSHIYARYKIKNNGKTPLKGKLFLAIRPFQVNPPWQKLNMKGGVAKINKIKYQNNFISVNDEKKIIPLIKPDQFGACPLNEGDIIDYIQEGKIPSHQEIDDPDNYASAVISYDLQIKKGKQDEYYLIIPFHKSTPKVKTPVSSSKAKKIVDEKMKKVISIWESRLSKVKFKIPPEGDRFINTLKINLAYVFINRDGYRIQPGSRSYLRSWIRDGSMTSSALLRMGNLKEVKEYLHYFSKFIFKDGRVPCVVDDRGAEGCPENDSNGEFIFSFMQYYHFTKDKSFLSKHFQQIKKAADFIIHMRNQRKTSEFRDGPDEKRVFYGLVPESISHEGYSAKPMHSHWDNFFSLKGLKDMVEICRILNKNHLIDKYQKEVLDYRKAIYDSMKLSMKMHNKNYLPGCAELCDFDATSTAIGIFPCGEYQYLPQPALNNTFDRYYKDFSRRLIPGNNWGEAYTPYEVRSCQAFIYMKKKERALKMFDYFFKDQRPVNWLHWSEVVWTDAKAGKWIGDMPHTWIGSGFVNAVRSMFVYEREEDDSLVLCAGLPEKWLKNKQEVGIENALTYYGKISYDLIKNKNKIKIKIWGKIGIPGFIIVQSPIDKPIKSVKLNKKKWKNYSEDEVRFKKLPAEIEINY